MNTKEDFLFFLSFFLRFMYFFAKSKWGTLSKLKQWYNAARVQMRARRERLLFARLFDQVEAEDRLILYKWIYCVMWAIKLIKGVHSCWRRAGPWIFQCYHFSLRFYNKYFWRSWMNFSWLSRGDERRARDPGDGGSALLTHHREVHRLQSLSMGALAGAIALISLLCQALLHQ